MYKLIDRNKDKTDDDLLVNPSLFQEISDTQSERINGGSSHDSIIPFFGSKGRIIFPFATYSRNTKVPESWVVSDG